jgi:hypothetical protein
MLVSTGRAANPARSMPLQRAVVDLRIDVG